MEDFHFEDEINSSHSPKEYDLDNEYHRFSAKAAVKKNK